MRKDEKEINRNISIRLIYEGICFIVSVMDHLDYEYMIYWRNEMMKWKVEMEKRYKWLGANQRNWNYCNKCS